MNQCTVAGAGLSRRAMLGGGTAAALSAASYGRVIGSNDRIGLGFIGFGLIGKRHVLDFREQPGVNMAAIAEVHRGRRDEAVALDRRRSPEATTTSAACSTIARSTPSSSRRPITGMP